MITQLMQYFKGAPKSKSDFADFFISASAREKKKVFSDAIRAANREQRELVDNYEKMKLKTN